MDLAMVPITLSPALTTIVLATTSAGRTHTIREPLVTTAAATDLSLAPTTMVILVVLVLVLQIIDMNQRDTVAQELAMNRGLWTVERCRISVVVQEAAATTPTARTLNLLSSALPAGLTLARWDTIRWARVVRSGINGRGTCKQVSSVSCKG